MRQHRSYVTLPTQRVFFRRRDRPGARPLRGFGAPTTCITAGSTAVISAKCSSNGASAACRVRLRPRSYGAERSSVQAAHQVRRELHGHVAPEGEGKKDTEKKRSGSQGGQHGERCHVQSLPTQDCVAPQLGRVHLSGPDGSLHPRRKAGGGSQVGLNDAPREEWLSGGSNTGWIGRNGTVAD